jgi:hypothetical protein
VFEDLRRVRHLAFEMGAEQQARGEVDALDRLGRPLVTLGPAGLVLTPGRGVGRKPVDQRQETPWALVRQVAQVEPEVPLKVGLEEVPAFG